MTTAEFSAEFDLLYNNIMSNMAPGLDEYEKSVFLTQAMEGVVLDLYKGNSGAINFEGNEEATEYLQCLVKEEALRLKSTGTYGKVASRLFSLPSDLMFIIQDRASYSGSKECLEGSMLEVVPITHDELKRVVDNPFRGVKSGRVLRLVLSDSIELLGDNVGSYSVRYLRYPKPIILQELGSQGLYVTSGDGVRHTEVTECELPATLHRSIILRAVTLAKAVWSTKQ